MSSGNYASDSMISDQMNDKENQDETRLSFENPAKKKKGLQFDWKQSNDSIDVTFKLDNLQITPEDAQRVDVTFSNSDVNVQFPNGNKWYCEFRHPVEAQNGKVFVKKNKIVLHVKKKEMILWADLQASPTPSRSTSGINLDDLQSLSPDSELSSQTLISPSSGIGTTFNEMSSTNSDDPISLDLSPEDENKKESDDAESLQDGEDEKLFDLTHAKHDFIEKEENIIVHVYIKEIKKDLLKVHFGEKQLHLLFQTKSEKFLKMHDGSTEDTTFSWKINLANEIIPDGCKYRLTNSFIEVTLAKSMKKRWGILEATLRKEGTQSTCWIPLAAPSNPSTTTPAITISPPEAGAQGHLAFDDLANVSVRKQELDSENRASAEMGASGVRKDSNSHKPMCKVSPMNKNVADMCVTPGFTGLDNLGNTCFMNSVLQCLGNTREFRDYFLSSKFQRDINQDNPLGMGGKLAVTFAVLLRVLWSGKHYSYAPSKLKNLISQKASQFTGFAQHDAQEFMAFLLDGLHEDVNRIKKKPYTETVDSDGRPDEVVADEAWEVYKKRNDSFIVDLLQGQYKSKLTCPVCGKISITFDPFLYLSLPLPKKKRYLPVIFFWRDPLRKPVQIGLRLPKDCTTEMVKEEASKQTGVSPKSMRIFEAYKGRIYKFYGKGTDFSGVQPNDVIIISEVLTEEMAGEAVYELYVIQRTLMPNQPPTRCSSCRKPCQDGYKLKRCTKCYKVGYCDHNCQKTHWSLHKLHCKLSPDPVGHPFILSIPESHATFSKLCSLMEAYSRYSVDVFQPPIKPDSKHQRINQSSPLSEISSNSSQSSGSISSLDSQSTCSSSCTLTGDQIILNELKSGDDNEQESAACSSSLETQVGESSTNIEQKLGSCYQQSDSSTSVINTVPHISPSDVELGCEVEVQDTYRERTQDMGAVNLPEYSSFKMPSHMRSDNLQRLETDESSGDSNSSSDVEKGNGSSVPMKPVLGIQSGDTDRQVPLFYIKPVNQEGMGIKGPEGTRLEDEGDTALDLSYRQYLSMDWINNEKCDNYVLVQSKDLEYEEDSGLSANSEENTNLTIHHCLKLFTDPEVLTPEEAWYCPQCKEHRQATKHMTIWRLPHTLIIQLKRFSFRNFIWRDKIDKLVEFPTRELDLSSYCLDVKQSSTPPLYDLYGVVNHYGGILGGHYTSFVRCADLLDPRVNDVDWRLCDDSRVTSIGSEKNAVTRGAYLLFYRQREPFKLLKCPSSNAELIEENKNNSQTLDNNVLNQDDLVEEKETVYEKVTKEIEEEYVNLEYRVDGYKSESEFSGFTKFDSSKQYEKGASLIYDSSQHYADSDVQKVPTREESSKLAYTDMEDVD